LPYPDRENEMRMIGDINGSLVFNSLNLYISEFFNHYLKPQESAVIQIDMANDHLEYIWKKASQKHEE